MQKKNQERIKTSFSIDKYQRFLIDFSIAET